MIKLLTADFKRLWTSKLFWAFTAFMVAFGFFQVLYAYSSDNVHPNSIYFTATIIPVLIIPLFNAMYIGEEYEHGSIRNKLIVGHKRWEVYISQFVVCSVAAILMHAPYFIICRLVGAPLLGSPSEKVLDYVVCLLICDISITAIATVTSILTTNKAIAIVAGLFVALALWAGNNYLVNWLEVPICYYDSWAMAFCPEDPSSYIPYRYSAYIKGDDRFWFHLITDSFPQGQALQINHMNYGEEPNVPANFWYYSLILTGLCNAAGIAVYNKVDLK